MLGTLPPTALRNSTRSDSCGVTTTVPFPPYHSPTASGDESSPRLPSTAKSTVTHSFPRTTSAADGEHLGQWLYRAVKKWRANTLPGDERRPLAALRVSPGPRPWGPRTATQPVG